MESGHPRGFCVFFSLVVLSLFGVSPAFPAGELTLALPCGKVPFPLCPALKIRMVEGNPTNPNEPGFRTMVKELIAGVYEGKVDAKGAEGTNGVRQAVERVGNAPICLALPIAEHDCRDEFKTNFKDQTCPPLSRVGQVSRDKYFYGLGRSASGTFETAHIAGGLVMGLSNQAQEIEKEVAENRLTIQAGSSCYARAEAFQSALQDQTNVRLLEKIAECDVTNTETCSTKKYFQSSLSTLQVAYLFLAKCRLIDEAAAKARKYSLNYVARIENESVKLCHTRNQGRPTQMKACYAKEFSTWIKTRAQSEFPLLTECTSTPLSVR